MSINALVLPYIILHLSVMSLAQNTHPNFFADISSQPDSITEKALLIHMIDGLGFRFYWATNNLRPEDFDYRISNDSRSCGETIEHIKDLSIMILAATKGVKKEELTRDISEKNTAMYVTDVLENLFEAREHLSKNYIDIDNVKIILSRPSGDSSFPVWNLIHGPISDAIWHSGQIAAFRRASGHPISHEINHFLGKKR